MKRQDARSLSVSVQGKMKLPYRLANSYYRVDSIKIEKERSLSTKCIDSTGVGFILIVQLDRDRDIILKMPIRIETKMYRLLSLMTIEYGSVVCLIYIYIYIFPCIS